MRGRLERGSEFLQSRRMAGGIRVRNEESVLGGLSPWEMLRRLYKEIYDDDLFGEAAQCAYAFAFALFPFLMFLVSLATFLPAAEAGTSVLPDEVVAQLPRDVRRILDERIEEVADGTDKTTVLTFSFLLTIWAASAGAAVLVTAVNRAYDQKEKRAFWKKRAIGAMLMLAGAVCVFLPALYGSVGGVIARVVSRQPYLAEAAFLIDWLRWPIVVAGAFAWLMLLYRVAPEGGGRWRPISPGAIVSAIGLLVANRGLSLYVENAKNLSLTYGTIGGFIVLLLWLYVLSAILLLGAEVNAMVDEARKRQPLRRPRSYASLFFRRPTRVQT